MMKLLYAGIRVRDLETSIRFYRKVMGMRVSRRGTMRHGGIWVELQSPGSPQRLELNWDPPGSRFHTPYRRGEGLEHPAFRVNDVDRALHELTAKGARADVQPFPGFRNSVAVFGGRDGKWMWI